MVLVEVVRLSCVYSSSFPMVISYFQNSGDSVWFMSISISSIPRGNPFICVLILSGSISASFGTVIVLV